MPHGDMGVTHEQGTASGSWSWINSNWNASCDSIEAYRSVLSLVRGQEGVHMSLKSMTTFGKDQMTPGKTG